jgi:hypothetical protein
MYVLVDIVTISCNALPYYRVNIQSTSLNYDCLKLNHITNECTSVSILSTADFLIAYLVRDFNKD